MKKLVKKAICFSVVLIVTSCYKKRIMGLGRLPDAPGNVVVSDIDHDNGNAEITWVISDNQGLLHNGYEAKIKGHIVEYSLDNFEKSLFKYTDGTKTSVILSDLRWGGMYSVRIYAENTSNEKSVASKVISFGVGNVSTPSGLFVTNISHDPGDVRLIWKISAIPNINYEVYYKEGPSMFDTVDDAIKLESGTVPGILLSFSDKENYKVSAVVKGLDLEMWYSFAVRALRDDGKYSPLTPSIKVYVHDGVNILVLDSGNHGRNVVKVLTNKSKPHNISAFDQSHLKEVFFPLEEGISYAVTESYENLSTQDKSVDIINASYSLRDVYAAKYMCSKLLGKSEFPESPLIVVSGSNSYNSCTEEAWNYLDEGGSLFPKILSRDLGCSIDKEHESNGSIVYVPNCSDRENEDKFKRLVKACNVFPSYIVKKRPKFEDNIIVVGGNAYDPHRQKPGPILKDIWISTYYIYRDDNGLLVGTSFSTPYVSKIAAEIKRRAPHYTNAEIKDIIFSTAHDYGDPGVDDIYGNGVLNPKGIFDELTKRGF